MQRRSRVGGLVRGLKIGDGASRSSRDYEAAGNLALDRYAYPDAASHFERAVGQSADWGRRGAAFGEGRFRAVLRNKA